MQRGRWIAGTSTLLAVFRAMRGEPSAEPQGRDRRTGSYSRQEFGLLTELSAVEAAMLQDLAWWGPCMENRLQQMTETGADG